MSAESDNISYAPTESAVPIAEAPDVEMVGASDLSGAKNSRNVQTQHGDSLTVDEENIFLIARCLWPEKVKKPWEPEATTSSDTSTKKEEEEEEQVVWIEPFANEVSSNISIFLNYSLLFFPVLSLKWFRFKS